MRIQNITYPPIEWTREAAERFANAPKNFKIVCRVCSHEVAFEDIGQRDRFMESTGWTEGGCFDCLDKLSRGTPPSIVWRPLPLPEPVTASWA